jgi:hypothetical protein
VFLEAADTMPDDTCSAAVVYAGVCRRLAEAATLEAKARYTGHRRIEYDEEVGQIASKLDGAS